MDYQTWLKNKIENITPSGFSPKDLTDYLYPFQKDITIRACENGKYALFCDTGLGKTIMQLAWTHEVLKNTNRRILILAPLAVAQQTVREGNRFGLPCKYLRKDDKQEKVVITNYEMVQYFNPKDFVGIVLDESSILKSFTGSTRNILIDMFSRTPYRLACTATPSPNDYTELGNHAEFLGYNTRAEMLSKFFVHDGETTQEWRLKGHAQIEFWKWVCGWATLISKPSDLGYEDGDFLLPPLRSHDVIVGSQEYALSQNVLFAHAATLNEQRQLRRSTLQERVKKAAELASINEPVLVWCELNDESTMLRESISDSQEVRGSDDLDKKVETLNAFSSGQLRCLVTKPTIAGFGMNWQHCSKIIFVGASHSFEQTYQAIRRCWRFGQKKPVDVWFIRADADAPISSNFRRKAENHENMIRNMSKYVNEGYANRRWTEIQKEGKVEVPSWLTSK